MPKRSVKERRVCAVLAVAIIRSFWTMPDWRIPPIMALAIFPPPMNPIVLSIICASFFVVMVCALIFIITAEE